MRRCLTHRLVVVLLLSLAFYPLARQSAHAGPRAAPTPSAQCLAAVEMAQHRYSTPPGLLAVMAKVESGRADANGALEPWPWAVDADGTGILFPTKQAAIAWTRNALATDAATYVDVGCLQVDLRMHPNAFRTLDDAFDPIANADYGARYLRLLHDGPARGNWFTAIGLYHSDTPELAAIYRTQVAAVAAGLPMPPAPAGSRVVRLDLVGGGVLRIHFTRQPARVHRRLTPCQINRILGSDLVRPVAGCGH
jgi:soluble lytic murein transglycosylase-like protein